MPFPLRSGAFYIRTSAIEVLNSKLRRAVRARGHFPTDKAAMKLLFLVLNHSEKEWPREWAMAKAQSAVLLVLKLDRRISCEGMVSVGGNYYSVPDATRRRVVDIPAR